MKLILTGSSGFVGKQFMSAMNDQYQIKPVSLITTKIDDIDFNKIDTIVHLAGMAHQMQEIDEKIYFEVNRDLTIALARKAKKNGVKHFIFISTVKVYGDNNTMTSLNENSSCSPSDPYGQSKFEAEEGLKQLETGTFKVAIIRPPLVYGKYVKGNLQRIMGLVEKLPVLPFDGINNARSMVYVGNLIKLIEVIMIKTASGVFIAGDREPHSTTKLVSLINENLASNKILVQLPDFVVQLIRKVKPQLANRLFDSYIVDNSLTNTMLNYTPPFSFEQGITEMVQDFKSSKK